MPDQQSAVVLLSAGLDSTYNLLKAREKFSVLLALTFNYGQKAAAREMERAARLAAHFKVKHQIVQLPWFADFTKTALVPSGREVSIDDAKVSAQTAARVWVPNRNGIFLNIAAGFAEGLGAQFVIPGFNLEEAQTFPDNSQDYLDKLDAAFAFSTATQVKTFCFSTGMNKSQIVREGAKAGLPFATLWPCYEGGNQWCGGCESCQRFKRALTAGGLSFDELRKS